MAPREYKKLRTKAKPKVVEVEQVEIEEKETYDFSKIRKDFNIQFDISQTELLYNIEFLRKTDEDKYQNFLKSVESGSIDFALWGLPDMEEVAKKEEDRVKNVLSYKPLFVSEGIETCRKCGCKKLWSFQTQSRSKDEGMTTTYVCSSCNAKFSSS